MVAQRVLEELIGHGASAPRLVGAIFLPVASYVDEAQAWRIVDGLSPPETDDDALRAFTDAVEEWRDAGERGARADEELAELEPGVAEQERERAAVQAQLDMAATRPLKSGLADIIGLADQRIDELSRRAVQATDGGSETFASFLILQALNRWVAMLRHLETLPTVHPERLFESLLGLTGELATLTLEDRRPGAAGKRVR